MNAVDRAEKLGRLVLWIVISCVLVIAFGIVPLKLVKQSEATADLRASVEKLKAELAKALEPKEPEIQVLTLASMGRLFRALDIENAKGRGWFTNASPRSGVVCVKGTASDAVAGTSTESLVSCAEVKAFATVAFDVAFAYRDLKKSCGNADCSLELSDAPVTK